MKRRKWWFIGLALALLAACVGVWKMDERPPYPGMEDFKLYYISLWGSTDQSSTVQYASPQVAEKFVARDAEKKMPRSWSHYTLPPGIDIWSLNPSGYPTYGTSLMAVTPTFTKYRDATFGDRLPPIPKGTKCTLTINRPTTPLDRFRGWFYSLRWKGP